MDHIKKITSLHGATVESILDRSANSKHLIFWDLDDTFFETNKRFCDVFNRMQDINFEYAHYAMHPVIEAKLEEYYGSSFALYKDKLYAEFGNVENYRRLGLTSVHMRDAIVQSASNPNILNIYLTARSNLRGIEDVTNANLELHGLPVLPVIYKHSETFNVISSSIWKAQILQFFENSTSGSVLLVDDDHANAREFVNYKKARKIQKQSTKFAQVLASDFKRLMHKNGLVRPSDTHEDLHFVHDTELLTLLQKLL